MINDAKLSDEILTDIRSMIFSYLHNEENIKNVKDTELVECFDFLNTKFKELNNIKNIYSTYDNVKLFEDVSKHLEYYNKKGTFTEDSTENLHIRLSKDLETTMIQIGLYHGILGKIIKQRKIFKH